MLLQIEMQVFLFFLFERKLKMQVDEIKTSKSTCPSIPHMSQPIYHAEGACGGS